MIFPWQTQQWQQLLSAQLAGRLPHALLLTGIEGIGKAQFAESFLHKLLCQADANKGMDCHAAQKVKVCHACRLITRCVHPNVLRITPEKKGQAIKVDQIREVFEFTQQTALQGEHQVVVIYSANNMNMNSANALLKTLEEPPRNVILILISDQASRMPATILSRCQRLSFPTPEKKAALHWLNAAVTDVSFSAELLLSIANGAPLLALDLVKNDTLATRQILFEALYLLSQKEGDPLQLAQSLQQMDILPFLDMTSSWMMDILRLQLGIDSVRNQDHAERLSGLAKKTNIEDNVKYSAYLQNVRKDLNQGIHLNKQLIIEKCLIRYLKIR